MPDPSHAGMLQTLRFYRGDDGFAGQRSGINSLDEQFRSVVASSCPRVEKYLYGFLQLTR